MGKSYKNSGHFHFGNNHPQMLTYYQIAAVIPKMALVRHLKKNICMIRTYVLNIYLDRSINFGTTITNAILTLQNFLAFL